jgi:hypothetical protein
MTKALKVVNQNTALATESDNPWSEIGTEHGTQTLLKYVKGVWFIKDDQVPLGTKYVAFIDELAQGFIKFNEEAAPEVHLGKVKFGRDQLPKRNDLGDVDQEEWPVVNGKPKDPYQPIMQLPLSPVERIGELVVFSAIGEGGARSAVADLCAIYGRSPRSGYLPIIELGTSSYKHTQYGIVHVPVLKLVSWHQAAPVIESDPVPSEGDYGADMDDEVAF